ncbi:MAG: bifunctional diaminohydroxyphosphoribosylaminopyrimidine deaminase/5-amino-6-(5-phosphoribosylamino)uracil reductase RibD [Candidatus Zixiibacteriota bacterium]|nr:MAG: bifunctional diaminohydroxyphosphoribosylaminopyrimidine deaminase/5-amino-6-(5-phosphoribosylamino)uracil reductase RibD [candidate division Zixibacteria bacterium]
MADKADKKYIELALKLAEKARGKTSPNPMVGAVVVKNNRIVGQGYHKKAGTAHAEKIALNQACNLAKDSILYVTLEPCCHVGRTDPCTGAIIRAGVKKVVYSIKDPNPIVNGCGIRCLKKAGIEVTGNVMAKQARRLNEVYLKYITTGRPFVVLKMAQSIDGRIATSTGHSQWISGQASLKFAHRLRSYYDAVVIGAGTVKADNPNLTVRLTKGNNPYRIILSQNPEFAKNINLFKHNNDCKTIVATSAGPADKLKIKNLTVWKIEKNRGNKNRLSLTDFLDKAGRFGITSILVEGGSGLATSFIREHLVDKFHFIMAPMIIGGGLDAISDLGIRHLDKALRFKEYEVEKIGEDCLFTGYLEG